MDACKQERKQHYHDWLGVNVGARYGCAQVFQSKNGQQISKEGDSDDDIGYFPPNFGGYALKIRLTQFT